MNPASEASRRQPDNSQILLETLVAQRHGTIAPELNSARYFELFSAEQLLKDREMSYEELQRGLVGGGQDGGIDAIYTFVNDTLIAGPEELPPPRRNSRIELFVLQAKMSNSFSSTAVDKLQMSISDLMHLTMKLDDLAHVYSEDLRARVEIFRSTYTSSISHFPNVSIRVAYSANASTVHPTTRAKADQLVAAIERLLPHSRCTFEFVDAAKLLDLARRQHPAAVQLRLAETPLSTTSGAYVGLVALKDYFDFITDDSADPPTLRDWLFESNVRDYEGPNTAVNKAIRSTLNRSAADDDHTVEEDFWWLNNGVTIVGSQVHLASRTLAIDEPQIVNGLQTSVEIARYYSAGVRSAQRDDRQVLVRVIVPGSELSRDRIIRATNSQTLIPGIALRATEKIQRDLQDFFLQREYFYERRKNYYQNLSKPIDRIFTIPFLAEAVLAVVYHEPNVGMPRLGGNFLNEDRLYKRIFSASVPLSAYFVAAVLVRRLELAQRRIASPRATRQQQLEVLPIAAMAVSIAELRSYEVMPDRVATLDVESIPDRRIEIGAGIVYDSYERLRRKGGVQSARRELIDVVREELRVVVDL